MTSHKLRRTEDGTMIARLPDGRDLAFKAYGDPDGRPVFYFHGTPSSRYEGSWAAEAAARHNVRLLAIDRPGMGLSSFQQGRTFRHWPHDVGHLADILGLDKFGIAGHSGGGAFIFAAACGLAHRLTFAIAFCPWGPPALGDLAHNLNLLDRLYFRIAKRFPGSMSLAFAPLGWCVRYFPSLFFTVMKRSVTAPDREALAQPGMQAHFTTVLQEAFRQGGRGPAWEALICYRPWGFDLADIPLPVHVWAGDQDIFVSNEMVEAMAQRLRHPIIHRLPGKGHLCIEHWEDAFQHVS